MKRLLLLIALNLLPWAVGARSPVPIPLKVARTYPYSMVGQLTFFSGDGYYVGSGTVIKPFGVLTAGHNLYDPSGGWSTDLVFKRSHYDESDLSVRNASRIYVVAGYQQIVRAFGGDDLRSFARDTGGVSFLTRPASGGFLGWTTNQNILTGSARKMALGYGAVVHSGEEPLVVGTPTFHAVYSTFFESDNTEIEAGMSGGPIIATLEDGSRAVCGVVVSGSDGPPTGGIRIVNSTVSDFISTYLVAPPAP